MILSLPKKRKATPFLKISQRIEVVSYLADVHTSINKSYNCPTNQPTGTIIVFPDNKFHGANMGPTWVLSAPDGPYDGHMNLAIGVVELDWVQVLQLC